MISRIYQYTEQLIEAYSEFWDMLTSSLTDLFPEWLSSFINGATTLINKLPVIGRPWSDALELFYNTPLIEVIITGGIIAYIVYQGVTWILNLLL